MAMADVARAIEKGETAGLMKLVVDGDTRKILGAAILGTGGDEAIHCILDLMYAGAPYTVLQRAMHIHPTVAELLPSLAAELTPVAKAPAAALTLRPASGGILGSRSREVP